jgi:hypothetical protein
MARPIHFARTRKSPGVSRFCRRIFFRSTILSVVLFNIAAASAKSIKIVTSWFNPKYEGLKFHKILVVGVAQDEKVRADFEDEMAAQMVRPGIRTIPGNQILLRPDPKAKPDLDCIRAQIGSNHIDAVGCLTSFESRQESDHHPELDLRSSVSLLLPTWERYIPLFTIPGTRAKTRR